MLSAGAEAGVKDYLQKRREARAEKVQAESYVPSDGWEAYFKDDKGRAKKLLLPIEQNLEKDWLGLQFTPFKGVRPRLAIYKIYNRTPWDEANEGQGWSWGERVPIVALEEMLTTALRRTGRFSIVERKRLDDALGEQDLGQTGRLNTKTAAEVGKVKGAELLLTGTVVEWIPEKSSVGTGLNAGSFLGSVGVGKKVSEVQLSFQIQDATTAEVIWSETVRGQVGNWGVSLNAGGLLSTTEAKRSDSISYAAQIAISKASYLAAGALKQSSIRLPISKVEGGRVWIAAGEDVGLKEGMQLIALKRGAPIVDPDTEVELGFELTSVGTVQVVSVSDRFTIAAVVDGCDGLAVGDRVEVAQTS